MRKLQVLSSENLAACENAWLDITRLASVEVTSQDILYPVQSAMRLDQSRGWRAASPGIQSIRIVFHEPQRITRIWMAFEDTQNTRTQQFLLRWSPTRDSSYREIVRQEWNFSPTGSVTETEDYAVDLPDVRELQLIILPDKRDSEVRASLRSLRLA
jgi:hypothetical protein